MRAKMTPVRSLQSISHLNNMEDLKPILEQYAKNANKRLAALERAETYRGSGESLKDASASYRQIKDWGEQNVDFITRTADGKYRFSRKTQNRSVAEVKREITELHEFLFKAKTSTVKGTREFIKKVKAGWETQDENNSKSNEFREAVSKMSLKEFIQLWENSNFKKLIEMYGSEIIIRIRELKNGGASQEQIDSFIDELVNHETEISSRDIDKRVDRILKLMEEEPEKEEMLKSEDIGDIDVDSIFVPYSS